MDGSKVHIYTVHMHVHERKVRGVRIRALPKSQFLDVVVGDTDSVVVAPGQEKDCALSGG